MAVNKRLKQIFTRLFEYPELTAANIISNFQERRFLSKFKDNSFHLSKEQKVQIQNVWKPYRKISSDWAAYYAAKNGLFSPYYIPNDLFYTVIDQHFNSRRLGYGFNDKNYYSKIFEDIPQPHTVVRKINSLLFDSDYKQISVEEGIKLMKQQTEVICKPSQESGSGRGIEFISTTNDEHILRILNDSSYDDYIVQSLITQHPALSKIHSSSINSIRICSLLMPDGVKILSAVLRMGAGDSRVDNATSGANAEFGGQTVGINEDGTLKKYSYGYYDGRRFEKHPDGVIFDGYTVPSFDQAVNLVRKAHPRIGHFRLVSWDIAIDESGMAILIEANMRKGGINFHQFNNGPLFENVMYESSGAGGGKSLTESILNEIFASKSTKK